MALPSGVEWEIYLADIPANWVDGATKQTLKDWSSFANHAWRGGTAAVEGTDFTPASDGGVFDGVSKRAFSSSINGWFSVTSCSALVVFKPAAVDTFRCMAATGSHGNLGNFGLVCGAPPGGISVEYYGNSYASVGGVITAGNWYCMVATKSPGPINTTTIMYLNDAVVAASGASTGVPAIGNGNIYLIGVFTGATFPFTGTIAAAAFWRRTLSAQEASDAYQSVGSQLASSGVTLPGITAPATTGHTAGRSYQIRKRRRENLERQMR
jgi:hypothetical protein